MTDELMERLAIEALRALAGQPGVLITMPAARGAVKAILSELSAAGVLNEWKPIESAPCDGTQFIAWGRFDCGTLWLNTDVYRWRDNWISVGDGIVCPQEWCSLPEAMLKARPV